MTDAAARFSASNAVVVDDDEEEKADVDWAAEGNRKTEAQKNIK